MAESRRTFLTMLAALPIWRAWAAASLALRKDDGVLRVFPPDLHFLEGRPMQRLQDGAGLVFSLQLTLSSDQFRTVTRRQVERFVVSFDLWEEKFAVMRLGLSKEKGVHLSRAAAERWIFDRAGIPLYGVEAEVSHWVRAELRADDPRESGGFLLDPAVTLNRLVEWFGRAPRGESQRWTLEQGPFRPAELRR